MFTQTYKVVTAPTGTAPNYSALADVITGVNVGGSGDLVTKYLACLPPQYTLDEIRAQWISPVRTAYRSGIPLLTIGQNAAAATVANDAAALTLRTTAPGRDQVATKHIGPVPDSVSSGGLLVNAYKNTLGDFGDAILQGIIAPGNGMALLACIWHRATQTSDVVQSHVVGIQSRVQRRRTVGVGI
jgi:hypothetical protein